MIPRRTVCHRHETAGNRVEPSETLAAAESDSDVVRQRVVPIVDDDLGRVLGQRPALYLDQGRLLHHVSDGLVTDDLRWVWRTLLQDNILLKDDIVIQPRAVLRRPALRSEDAEGNRNRRSVGSGSGSGFGFGFGAVGQC